MTRSVLSAEDRELLLELAGDAVAFDAPMAKRTTLRMGGPADAWVAPASTDTVAEVARACSERNLPVVALGAGTNLLVRDGGIRGVVLVTRNLRALERVGETEVRVEAGVSTGKLLSSATKWELGGVEFLGGVPGSVGGGLVMNAGTYLGEFKDVTRQVTSVRLDDGALVCRDNEQCGFVYRGSALPGEEIVVEARLTLAPRARAEIEADVAALRAQRKEREPRGVHVVGSVFKNPPDDYAGRLIEAAGLKGTRIGDAECSPAHANWLVNTNAASAADMLALIDLVRSKVREQFGVDLELEVKVLGED
jgi:UDP-N-acetylmuramate dehydrogenase